MLGAARGGHVEHDEDRGLRQWPRQQSQRNRFTANFKIKFLNRRPKCKVWNKSMDMTLKLK